MTLLTVDLDPIDPIQFGDSRSARAGLDHVGSDQEPSPATIFGAIGGRIARSLGVRGQADWNQAAEETLGPFAADLRSGSSLDGPKAEADDAPCQTAELLGYAWKDIDQRLWFPCPRHFLLQNPFGEFAVAGTLRPDSFENGFTSLGSLSPLKPKWIDESAWDAEAEEPAFIDETLLSEVLTMSQPIPEVDLAGRVKTLADLQGADVRIGIAMDNDRQATIAGRLFNRTARRFWEGMPPGAKQWRRNGLRAWYRVLKASREQIRDWDGIGYLGGDRRRVRLSFALADKPLQIALERTQESIDGSAGFLAALLTPAVVEETSMFRNQPCIAAATGKPLHFSGWSGASRKPGPRRMLALYPAGSVFFFSWGGQHHNEETRAKFLAENWMKPLSPEYGAFGFGRVLLGVWHENR